MNILTVEANKEQLVFWVNNVRIGSAVDTNFKEGNIGVVVGFYANASDETLTQATFRNVRVWQID
jgi:hypothetical protein